MSERLLVYDDEMMIKAVPLSKDELSLGRISSNDVVLDDGSISRKHARVIKKGSGWNIEDLGSTNGIEYRGVRVQKSPLKPGEKYQLGRFTVLLEAKKSKILVGLVPPSPQGRSEETYRDLQALFRLNGRFSTLVAPKVMLETMMDRLMEIFRADRGFVLLGTNPETMKVAVKRGIEFQGIEGGRSRTFLNRAIQEKAPVISSQDQLMPETVDEKIRSILCAPLLEEDQAFGAIYVDSLVLTRTFDDQDRDLMALFCENVANSYRAVEERGRLQREVSVGRALARQKDLDEHDFRDIVGQSRAIKDTLHQVQAVAEQDVTVLIEGESGTGKELIAKAIHYCSKRKEGPFVAINCMALSKDILESELFGHEKGAFSGADSRRVGKLEMAHQGTIFLDEVGELSHDIQVKLLRVLEAREIQRVGGNETIPLNIRVVAATNVDMKRAVELGNFRSDLYYRLGVFTLSLPPLRQRKEDIPLLVDFFLDHFNDRMGKQVDGPTPEVTQALVEYPWPGNIRELKNIVERAMVLTSGDKIQLGALPYDIQKPQKLSRAAETQENFNPAEALKAMQSSPETSGPEGIKEARKEFEKELILKELKACKGNVSATARKLGIRRATLYRKFEALGIDLSPFGRDQENPERDDILKALREAKGSISQAARLLGIPRTRFYRTMDLYGLDIQEIRAQILG